MNENKEPETTEELTLTSVPEVITPVNNTDLGIDELIEKIDLLAQNKKPYIVSKEVEELKSIFYIKLKEQIKTQEVTTLKEETSTEQEGASEDEKAENKLHPLEIKFKKSYGKFKKVNIAKLINKFIYTL